MPSPSLQDLLQQARAQRQQDAAAALALSQQAHALATRQGDVLGQARSLLRWAECEHVRGGSRVEGVDRLQQALALLRSHEDWHGEAEALNLLACLHASHDELEEAHKLHQQALRLRRRLQDAPGEAESLNNLAGILADMGQLPEALALRLQAVAQAETLGDAPLLSHALCGLGELQWQIGDLDAALPCLERALSLLPPGTHPGLRSRLLLRQGQVLGRLGQDDTGLQMLELACDLARQCGHVRELERALLALGTAQLRLGRHALASELLGQAWELALGMGERGQQAAIRLAQGRNALQSGQHGQAQQWLAEALYTASHAKATAVKAQAHRAMSDLCAELGSHEHALWHFRQFHDCEQQLHGERTQRRLREVLARQQALQTEQAMALERQRNHELTGELLAVRQADQEKQQLLTQLSEQTEQLRQLAREDGLTGLANRRWLETLLAREFDRARRYGHPLSVVMLDLDHFKQINDRYSHQTGDDVLRRVAGLLRQSSRRTDIAARWGGEEFMLVLVETPQAQAADWCERLRQRIAELRWDDVHPELTQVTASIGLACDPQVSGVEQLCSLADAALYRAKHGGRNRVCIHGQAGG